MKKKLTTAQEIKTIEWEVRVLFKKKHLSDLELEMGNQLIKRYKKLTNWES